MNTTLLIMAAGIGSRFGTGIKQLEPVDASNHIIMDYSIHDAIEAGFNHVVFIIRQDIEKEFKVVIGGRIAAICSDHNVTVDYAFQDIKNIPGTLPEGRTKPWGTGQAVLAAKKVIKTPFIVINADDYYGKYQNDRMDIARAIVKGIGVNIYEVLYHYYKHGKKEVKNTIDWIKKSFFPQVVQAEDVKELMAYEGEVWMRFYGDFVYFLPEDFVMNKRVKRPPDNPINALISFGNTLLYTKTIAAIYQTHLDQRISFLHEPSEGRFSLSLDLSEVFKPVIVFKTIFDLVNNRRLQVEKHFDKQVNYCVLNEEGRKIFIESFEERLESVFMHPKLKRKVSYRTALKLDCYKLIKNILEEKEFVPFSLKEGM